MASSSRQQTVIPHQHCIGVYLLFKARRVRSTRRKALYVSLAFIGLFIYLFIYSVVWVIFRTAGQIAAIFGTMVRGRASFHTQVSFGGYDPHRGHSPQNVSKIDHNL